MEQGSQCGVHNSNQNNLLALINNFVTQGADFEGNPSPSNIVVSANTTEKLIFSNTLEANSLRAGQVEVQDPVLANVSSCSVNELPIPETSGLVNSIGKSVSHNNIRKTISDIASNQISLLPGNVMPENALLETTIPMTNIAASSANEYMAVRNGLEMPPPVHNNVYPTQTWNAGAINTENNVENTGFTTTQACLPANVNPAVVREYTGSSLPGTYMPNHIPPNDYQNQPRQFLPQTDHCSTNNSLDQYLQSTQLAMQDYQHGLTQPNFTTSTAQCMTTSTYEKMNAFRQGPMCINSNLPATLSQPTTLHQSLSLPYDESLHSDSYYPKVVENGRKMFGDTSSEENISENSMKEKKLTTTPIPSDAEKMSSSSSVSSSSHEESPSPNETDSDPSLLTSRSFIPAGSAHIIYKSQAVTIASSAHCDPGSVDTNASNIPVPQHATEVEEKAMNCNMVDVQREKDTIPVSPLNSSDANSSAGNTASGNVASDLAVHRKGMHSDKTSPSIPDSGSSWSVIKEERRKQKMEKKMLQDKDQEVGSDRVSVSRDKSVKIDSQTKKQRHKHKHRSKHHHYHMPANVTNLPGENNSSSSPYRGLIPKVTADPTNNTKLNYSKPAGPPRSITEKVKQQMMKQQIKAMSGSKHVSHLKPPAEKQKPEQLTSQSVANVHVAKSTSFSHIAPAKFSSSSKESGAIKSSTCRWQTVTAIEGPKMPPMLSESDRIPKRGRPSKKTSAINLKYKAEKAKAEAPKAPVEKQNLVAMYTISANGCYEKLESKPKQNQRSKERAEAFRNELLEITKKTTIQKKTAGAKDVIGAFKAVGVRTRHQASNPVDVDDAKKKLKAKGKIFGGETTTSKGNDKVDVMDENAVYTFSELAKQFKISSSIVYRAMEQAQRSSMSKRVSKSSQKHKEKHVENRAPKPKAEQPKPVEESLPAPPAQTPQISPKLSAISPSSSGEYAPEKTALSTEKADSTSPFKPTSLSSEKSTDLIPDVVKRKKKKKKHKKEKNEQGKKKKKDKKKKSKRKEIRNSSDSVFNLEANEVFSVSSVTKSPEKKEKLKESKKSTEEKHKKVSKHSDKKSRKNRLSVSTETVFKKVDSVSSISGGDDAYDGGDSSSDTETVSPGSQSQPKLSAVSSVPSSLPATTVVTSTSATATIFGSGISSLMPTFQGIKEHGGLQQYSEHTKNLAEASPFRVKKHKHKKKKPLSRAKNVIDPEFLSKMEKLVDSFRSMKISPIMRFVSSPFNGQQTSNVFASEPKSLGGQEHKDFSTSCSKRTTETASISKQLDADSTVIMSVFCSSQFFQNYGYIKPYSLPSESNLIKRSLKGNSVKPAMNNFDFSADSNASPVFQKSKSTDSNASNDTNQRVQEPDPSNKDLRDEAKISNRQKRPAKKTRGWPRGKPRKPRPTSSSVNNENEITVASNIQSPEANARSNPKEKRDVTPSPITSQHLNTVDKPSPLVQSSATKAGTLNSNTTTASAAPVAPINQDLVDHIKAAITASLSSAAVCSEAVAKTVDSAVASYFHNFKGDASAVETLLATSSSQQKEKPVEKEQSDGLVKKKRNRVGRPNKYLKLIERVNELNEDNKCSDKHPKKVWASKHQDSSLAPGTEEAKPKKRGPGRPRKYPSLDGSPPAKVSKKSQGKTSSSKSESMGKGRVALPVQNSKPDKKSKPSKPLKVVVRGKRTGVGNWGNFTNNSKPKSKTKTLSSNEEKDSDLHLNLTAESTGVEDAFGAESSDTIFNSAFKGTAKKSLESVVAKLKRKQSASSPISNNEDGDTSPTQEHVVTGNDENSRHFSASSDDFCVKNDSTLKMKAEKRKGTSMANEEPPKKKGIKKSSSVTEKKWIKAGLFSSTFKHDGFESVSADAVDEPLFPAPLHAGLFLRKKQENFKLAHDIWSLYCQKRISMGKDVTDTYVDTNTRISPCEALFHDMLK